MAIWSATPAIAMTRNAAANRRLMLGTAKGEPALDRSCERYK